MKLIQAVTGRDYNVSGGFWRSDSSYPASLMPHIGTDYPLNEGTELMIPTYVIITKIGGHPDYGRQVWAYDPNNDVTYHWAHLSWINPDLSVGDGRYIGYNFADSGSTGKGFDGNVISNGVVPHLHFGVAKGRVTETYKYIGNNGESLVWLDTDKFNIEPTNNDGQTPVAPAKTVHEVALEVIKGQWGNDPERSEALTNAGYDSVAVQDEVNAILEPAKPAPAPEPAPNRVGKVLRVVKGSYHKATFTAYADRECTKPLIPWTMANYEGDLTFKIVEDHDPVFKCVQWGYTPMYNIDAVYIKWESGIGFSDN